MKKGIKKSIFPLVCSLAVILGGCNEAVAQSVKYDTNGSTIGKTKIDFNVAKAGDSDYEAFSNVGDYQTNDNKISLVGETKVSAFNQYLLTDLGEQTNYKLTGTFQVDQMKEIDGIYNKMGFYAIYKNAYNWVQVFLHPLLTESFVSVCAVVDGNSIIVWQVFPIKGLGNFQNNVNLEIDKLDNRFRIFVNGIYGGEFKADIDKGMVGLIGEATNYTVSNISCSKIDSFPHNTEGYGDASDMKAVGDFDFGAKTVYSYGTENESVIFGDNENANFKVISKYSFEKVNKSNDMFFGYYLEYVDKDNFIKLTFKNDLTAGTLVTKEAGVEVTDDFTLSGVTATSAVDIYKVDNEVRVYVDGTSKYDHAVPELNGKFGYITKNATGIYDGFTLQKAQSFPVSDFGKAIDEKDNTYGNYSYKDGNLEVISSDKGGYENLERFYYTGMAPKKNVSVSANIYVDSTEGFDGNTKYGVRFYADSKNYYEMFIVPQMGFYTNDMVNGSWGNLWTKKADIPDGFDFTSHENVYTVEKFDDQFIVSLNGTELFRDVFEGLKYSEVQACLLSEKTAHLHYDNLIIKDKSGPVVWGDAYNNVDTAYGDVVVDDNNVTIRTSENGGYDALERIFYTGIPASENLKLSANVFADSTEGFDGNTKYGVRFVADATNYAEIFILPTMGLYVNTMVAGAWGKLWSKEYDFGEEFDFTAETNEYSFEKEGAVFTVKLNGETICTFEVEGLADKAVQVGILSEKSGGVHFEDITIE